MTTTSVTMSIDGANPNQFPGGDPDGTGFAKGGFVSNLKLPRDQVAALRAEDLQMYVQSRGWRLDEAASSDRAAYYRLPDQADTDVAVPRRRNLGDYVLR